MKRKWITLLLALGMAFGVTGIAACSIGGGSRYSKTSTSEENSGIHTHAYTLIKKNATHHWTECACGKATITLAHSFSNGQCSVCGFYQEIQGLVYELSSNKSSYILTGITSEMEEVVIPSTYMGLPVTSIGEKAFYACVELKKVTIGNNVESIGAQAFQNCSNLSQVVISIGVKSIGDSAFRYCSKLTDIELPDGVKSIGSGAFYGCSKLTSVTIGSGVIAIGRNAFTDCSNLTSAIFKNPNGWTVHDTTVPAVGLSDKATAAIYLKMTYNTYDWIK